MTSLQVALTAVGVALLLLFGGGLAYTVWALRNNRMTVSGWLKNAPRLVVFAVGFGAGAVIGGLAAHWWWPTVGG